MGSLPNLMFDQLFRALGKHVIMLGGNNFSKSTTTFYGNLNKGNSFKKILKISQ
jgi:hypothetical protein